MTLSKLAQLANVSVSVVSKAFSGREDVSDAMREHVFAVAREHGCFQQFYHARYDKPVIAVIIPEAISKYYIHIIEALKRGMEANGYTMLLSISNFDNTLKNELVRYYTEHSKVDGLVLIDASFDKAIKCDTVLVSVLGSKRQIQYGSEIYLEKSYGINDALEHLMAKGHRRIAFVGEAYTVPKQKKFEACCSELGLAVDACLMYTSLHRFEEAGRDGVRKLFSGDFPPPSAIFGAYGYITQGILSELEVMGLRVPEDVSVISIDNDPYPLHGVLDVACIPSDIELLCIKTIEILCQKIGKRSPNLPIVQLELKSRFYEGNTIKDIDPA
ncbi:MAG: LacI family transcriptional regulator [Ruminococcaceae bacterium]|nr:LacI family transcriptional regulator [Oscillospiraceae bacterium]